MKRISRILLLGGLAAAAFVALLAALFLLMPGGGEDTAQASGGSGGFPTIFGVDVDPDDDNDGTADNGATYLGTIDYCIQVESTETGPTVPGPVFDIDVFLDDVPTGNDLAGANFWMYYDQNYLQVNGWSGPTGLGCRDWLLTTQAGSTLCGEYGDAIFPDTDGTLSVAIADPAGAVGAELPGALGVLDRYEMEVVAPGPQVVGITFAGAPDYLYTSVPTAYNPDEVRDGNYDPHHGIIAIDRPCPPLGDSDEDTIPDGEDNCPYVPNPAQENHDTDEAGDACDPDDDGDDICDPDVTDPSCSGSDNCWHVLNPLQENHDGDGAGDACDCDDDNDGTPDNQEIRNDTDPLDSEDYLPPDTNDDDSDGALNWEEDWVGTDPFDACGDDCSTTHTDDAWPFDITIDCWCTSLDILMFPANVLMPAKLGDEPSYQCRYDVNPDSWVNATDMLTLVANVVMPKKCTNP